MISKIGLWILSVWSLFTDVFKTKIFHKQLQMNWNPKPTFWLPTKWKRMAKRIFLKELSLFFQNNISIIYKDLLSLYQKLVS